jgi:hypothetical protein
MILYILDRRHGTKMLSGLCYECNFDLLLSLTNAVEPHICK